MRPYPEPSILSQPVVLLFLVWLVLLLVAATIAWWGWRELKRATNLQESGRKDGASLERGAPQLQAYSRARMTFRLVPGERSQVVVEALPPKLPADDPTESHAVVQADAQLPDAILPESTPLVSNGASPEPVEVTVEVAHGTRLRLTVESLPARSQAKATEGLAGELQIDGADSDSVIILPSRGAIPARRIVWREALRAWPYSLDFTLFAGALILYLLVRLVGLAHFPIFFFTDEAVQTVSAMDLLQHGLRGPDGVLLPTYFQNGTYYNLSLTVYLQVLPYLLFGKSVFATRAVTAVLSLLAAAAVGLSLRNVFKVRFWWIGTLLLSLAPAWFLHSRTAFETAIFVSFYAGMLYTYLMYRCVSPRYLYPTLILAALAFYSYSPGQVIIAATGFLLAFSDLGYHWQNRKLLLKGLLLMLLLALPYLRFRLIHASAPFDHLRDLGSYWVKPIPMVEKLKRFVSEYLYGLSPGYWFLPNGRDLERHLMKGYGHLLRSMLPFFLVGLGLVVRRIRSAPHRAVLAALLAAPVGGALVGIGITRVLAFVIPATLMISLGVVQVIEWLGKLGIWLNQRLQASAQPNQRSNQLWGQVLSQLSKTALAVGLFLLLGIGSLSMLRDALVNGPLWFTNYGLGGMQYGASQLFPAVLHYLSENPGMQMTVSPSWSNGTDVVARFFVSDPLPFTMGSIEGYMNQRLPLDEQMAFVMIPEEFQHASQSEKFTDIRVEKTLNYPDGRPGFYFVRLSYVEDIDAILARERDERRQLLEEEVNLKGEAVLVRYSMLDMGQIGMLFDGDRDTVARTLEANPFVLELHFPSGQQVSGLNVIVGSAEVEIRAIAYQTPGDTPLTLIQTLRGSVNQPEVKMDFGQTVSAQVLRVEVKDIHQNEPAHVHIWEMEIR